MSYLSRKADFKLKGKEAGRKEGRLSDFFDFMGQYHRTIQLQRGSIFQDKEYPKGDSEVIRVTSLVSKAGRSLSYF
jgi:hypothetical protein